MSLTPQCASGVVCAIKVILLLPTGSMMSLLLSKLTPLPLNFLSPKLFSILRPVLMHKPTVLKVAGKSCPLDVLAVKLIGPALKSLWFVSFHYYDEQCFDLKLV